MARSTQHNIFIGDEVDKRWFLRGIFLSFVDTCWPRHDGFLDVLRATQFISQEKEQTLLGLNTTKNQARQVWCSLFDMPVKSFVDTVLPNICELYSHVVAEFRSRQREVDSLTYNHQARVGSSPTPKRHTNVKKDGRSPRQVDTVSCLRCHIQRTCVFMDLADLLFNEERLRYEDYHTYLSNHSGRSPPVQEADQWSHLFQACRSGAIEAKRLSSLLENLLKDKLNIPPGFQDTVGQGFPCSCNKQIWKEFKSRHQREPRLTKRDLNPSSVKLQHDFYTHENIRPQHAEEKDHDFERWWRKAGLSQETADALGQSGIRTIADLNLLREQGHLEHLRTEVGMPVLEFSAFTRALNNLPLSASLCEFMEPGRKTRILMCGKTGNGKSSSGNMMLGERVFETSAKLHSSTKQCDFQSRTNNGHTLEITDCPGLYDTKTSNHVVGQELVQAMGALHPGPDFVLYFIRLDCRYTPEEHNTYRQLKSWFDEDITRHMVVAFTRGDELERKGLSVTDVIHKNAPQELEDVLRECGHRYVVLNNEAMNPRPQLKRLADEIKQVKAQNDNLPYTCVKYSEFYEEIEKEAAKRCQNESMDKKSPLEKGSMAFTSTTDKKSSLEKGAMAFTSSTDKKSPLEKGSMAFTSTTDKKSSLEKGSMAFTSTTDKKSSLEKGAMAFTSTTDKKSPLEKGAMGFNSSTDKKSPVKKEAMAFTSNTDKKSPLEKGVMAFKSTTDKKSPFIKGVMAVTLNTDQKSPFENEVTVSPSNTESPLEKGAMDFTSNTDKTSPPEKGTMAIVLNAEGSKPNTGHSASNYKQDCHLKFPSVFTVPLIRELFSNMLRPDNNKYCGDFENTTTPREVYVSEQRREKLNRESHIEEIKEEILQNKTPTNFFRKLLEILQRIFRHITQTSH